MSVILFIVSIVVAYLIGSLNFSVLISKHVFKDDIRNSGSGNAGATNMLRTYGTKWGVTTLVLDVLKGVVAVGIAIFLRDLSIALAVDKEQLIYGVYSYGAACFVTLGHIFPFEFGFKGGKGVSTMLGALLVANPLFAFLALIIGVLTITLSKYVSLGSVIGGCVFLVCIMVSAYYCMINVGQVVFCVITVGVMIFKHKTNISRLINNQENVISFRPSEAGANDNEEE